MLPRHFTNTTSSVLYLVTRAGTRGTFSMSGAGGRTVFNTPDLKVAENELRECEYGGWIAHIRTVKPGETYDLDA